jgi:hypothetical protein
MDRRPHKSPIESLQYRPEHDRVFVTTTEPGPTPTNASKPTLRDIIDDIYMAESNE